MGAHRWIRVGDDLGVAVPSGMTAVVSIGMAVVVLIILTVAIVPIAIPVIGFVTNSHILQRSNDYRTIMTTSNNLTVNPPRLRRIGMIVAITGIFTASEPRVGYVQAMERTGEPAGGGRGMSVMGAEVGRKRCN